MLSSTAAIVIQIPNGDEIGAGKERRTFSQYCAPFVSFINKLLWKKDAMKRLTHSIKVGIALVVVSLFYLRDPLKVGDNAMWAIMTVVVVFESSAGATLAKGVNRGFGTILGGGLGCGATILAKEFGAVGSAIIIVGSVFVFGTAATYTRSIPCIKRSYDYGVVIFIITFNIVIVSGLHAQRVLEIARDRVSTVGVGFGICVFTSLFIFPAWASEELHQSIASKFEKLSCSIEGSLEEGFRLDSEGNHQPRACLENCNDVLNSKSQDLTLVNFARWEPWHGKFGLHHPCDRYFHIGEALREMAASTLSLNRCLHSARQTSPAQRQVIKGPCEIAGALLVQTLRELGESMAAMRRYRPQGQPLVALKVQSTRLQLSLTMLSLGGTESGGREGLAIAGVVFLLGEMADQLEALAKEVEDLGEHAGFHAK